MKKTVFLAVAVITMFFTACNGNENEPISDNDSYVQIRENPLRVKVTNVENVYGEIDFRDIAFAKAIGYYRTGDDEWHNYLEFPAKYENGGFELNLSDAISDEYLQVVSNREDREGVALSDTQAKFMFFGVHAHNSTNMYIGSLRIGSENWNIEFRYADRDFSEIGISKFGEEFDCSYKKGWNVVYYFYDGVKTKSTTQKPLNENFKCYFEIYRL
jgi:hypothetical protein